jgi:outer membrane protein assembly factor BamB/enterochelin esterase-like enzyme
MVSAVLVGLCCFSVAAQATEWARWLGPNQDGTILGSDLFPAENFGLEVAWNRPLGIAYSGIAISGGRAVTMFADGEFDWLTAVDAKTGEELWRYKIDTMYAGHDGSEGGPISMPVVDGDVVFGLGAKGHLFAVRLDSGEEIWTLRIDEEFGGRPPHYGFTTTPLVVGDLLFVQTGGDEGRSLTALDKSTGKLRWSTGDDKVGYESPVLATLAGREQIVAVTDSRVLGLVADSGEVLWSHEHGTVSEEEDGYATPILMGEDRFLLTGQEESKAYKVNSGEAGFEVEELWSSSNLKQSLASPVLHEGHLYGFSGEFLTCLDVSSGDKVWKSRPPGGRGLILVDGHLVIFANDGSVVVAQASPGGYMEEARVKVSARGTYTYPSYGEDLVVVRNTTDFAGISVSAAPAVPEDVKRAVAKNDFERFVREVEAAEDKRLLIDHFMASQPSFPIVEEDRWVHFVHRGDVEDVAITGSMTEFQVEEPLQRIEGTDLYYRSYPTEAGARWEYRLNVDFENLQPDPLNPRRVSGSQGDLSEMITAGWTQPDYLQPYKGDRPGRIETFKLSSEILGNEREVDVYLPAGYAGGDARYPLLIVNNGKDWLGKAHLANTLNHLIGRDVAPVIVAGVEMPRETAHNESGGEKSSDYVRMLAEELVPQLDEKYRTLAEPGSRAVMGVTQNALMATYAAVQRPDVFGMAVGYSFYLPEPGRGLLFEAIEKSSGEDKTRFWVVWNENDVRRAEWDVDLARDSRTVAEALEAKGYTVVTEEAADSAGWGGWCVRAGEALKLMFPR